MKSRFKILFLLFLCLLRYVVSGRATKGRGVFRKIVIFQNAKLGDMVCTTPMFRAIKEKYPDCTLFVIGNEVNKYVLEHNPDVDGYIVYKDDGVFSTIKKIKEKDFDFGCITGPSFLNLAILYLAGIPLIAAPIIKNGWSPFETKSYVMIRKFVEERPHHMGQYAPREYLRLLEPANIHTEKTKKYLGFSELASRRAKEMLQQFSDARIIGIAPAAGNKIKEWPVDRFAEVASHAAEKYGAKIVIIGSNADRKHADGMIARLSKNVSFEDMVGALSLDELKAVIAHLNMFIAVDTGPIYIAEAFEIPTIDIVGPMDENEQPPRGRIHRIVLPLQRKKPELHVMNARLYDHNEARRQVESVSASMVIAEMDALFKELES